MSKPRPPSTPGAVVLRCFLVASWLWFAVPWLWTLCSIDGASCYHMTPAAADADLRSIRERLSSRQDQVMQRLFPEGRLFSHSFYGFTLINLAADNPQDRAFRQYAISELTRLIPRMEALAPEAPFDVCQSLTPKGGIIVAGHTNLLRAGYALLGGTDPGILAAYHLQSELIFQAFSKSSAGSLESYPALTWPVDSVAALESLRLHDVRYQTSYSGAAERWAQWMSTHLDSKSGLLNMQIDQHGGILDGPRGCGLSWTLAFLPNLAPDLARQQYAIYRATWFRHPLGLTGIREFPLDRSDQFIDPDTGPIIFGMGMAAAGFGIAAAKANNDRANLTGLLRALDIFSFPMYSTDLSRTRFFGQLLLADELALWGMTLTRWDAPNLFPPSLAPPAFMRYFWLALVLLFISTILVAWPLVHAALGAWRSCRQVSLPFSRVNTVILALAILTLLAFLLIPAVRWIYAFVMMAVLEVIESRFSRVRANGWNVPRGCSRIPVNRDGVQPRDPVRKGP